MNEADQHLLKLVLAGDPDGWSQFIGRYQKRLTAFAVRRINETATAEDLVQETFVSFLKGMSDYQIDREPEALLFHILRRRIVDHYRKQGRRHQEHLLSSCQPEGDGRPGLEDFQTDAPSADWSLQQSELGQQLTAALHNALNKVAVGLQSDQRLRDLKIAEGLFYAGLKNKRLAELVGVTENEVAYVKHRLLKKIRDSLDDTEASFSDLDTAQDISPLQQAWEQLRPTCPKRSTLGKSLMGLLDPEWQNYVQFHAQQLGCTICLANLDDLQLPAANEDNELQQRLLQSTIGFLKRSSNH